MTSLTYRYVALTDTGLRRPANQDSGYASPRLLVIADGMGGAAAGDLASAEAMHIIRQLDRDLDVDAMAALQQAVTAANARLGELIANDPAVEGMGTTLEAMLWDGSKIAFAHLGDSRAYRLRDGVLEQISTDHTFVQSLVDEGKISRDEARVHPHRSLLAPCAARTRRQRGRLQLAAADARRPLPAVQRWPLRHGRRQRHRDGAQRRDDRPRRN